MAQATPVTTSEQPGGPQGSSGPRWVDIVPRSDLAVFAYVLAWGLSLHLAAEQDWFASPAHAAATLSALWLLVRPNSLPGLVALSCSWVALWAWEAPRAFNHTTLFAIMLVAVPLTVLDLALRRRAVTPDAVRSWMFPYVRALVYALFGFAVLHKLNLDYFEPAWSCGVDHVERLVDRAPLLPSTELDSIGGLFIVGSLLLELSIPVLLAMRRTRTAGLVAAAGFHYLVGFNSLWSFSGPAVALYVAFLPLGTSVRIRERLLDSARWRTFVAGLTGTMVAIVVIGALHGQLGSRLGLATYVVAAVPLMAGLILVSHGHHERLVGRPRSWQWALVALALVVGLSPYLGLGTRANIAMFSNLQTEGGEWNHLFMPEAMQVFGHQDQLITIVGGDSAAVLEHVDTSGTHLSTSAATGADRIVGFEFRRAVADHCSDAPGATPLTFLVDGERIDLADVCADDEWSTSAGFPLDRLFRFRIVSTPSVCRQ